MRMKQYLFTPGRTVFSCEVFPPKRTSPIDSIYRTLDGLKDIRPDFISVTFGAGGSQVNLLTLLARSSDTLCLMSYRDTANGILSAGAEEMPLGTSCNCKIVLGVETYSEEGDSVSFMEEGKAVMYNALQSVLTSMSQKTTLGAGYGCAIHQIEVWYSLKD